MATTPATEVARLRLAPYEPAFAATIARWAPTPRELLWLAPATPFPLTAEKVNAWSPNAERRFVLFSDGAPAPLGYAELDFIAPAAQRMWIGHFVLAPAARGRGLSVAFAAGLLRLAFDRYQSSDVMLLVFPENDPAVRCYERAGFVDDGVEQKHFEHNHSRHELRRMIITRAAFRRQQALAPQASPGLPFERGAE